MRRIFERGEERPAVDVVCLELPDGRAVCVYGHEMFLGRDQIVALIRRAMEEAAFWDGVVGLA